MKRTPCENSSPEFQPAYLKLLLTPSPHHHYNHLPYLDPKQRQPLLLVSRNPLPHLSLSVPSKNSPAMSSINCPHLAVSSLQGHYYGLRKEQQSQRSVYLIILPQQKLSSLRFTIIQLLSSLGELQSM